MFNNIIFNKKMCNKIVFFHHHVNGDCFLSRILVKQIIDATKLKKNNYYYTAERAITSHCLDLGIPDNNFNVVKIPNNDKTFYVCENMIFINIWIGIKTHTVLDLNMTCAFCLNNLIPKYNILINELNKELKIQIPMLDTNINKSPYLPLNNAVYDHNNFIGDFIQIKKQQYKKIVLICNNNPSTFNSLENITQRYLLYITQEFPEYLFITFETTLLQKENLISIKQIYTKTNTEITDNWGMMFPLLSKLSDKVILLPTGPSFACFNNETTKHKFMMFFDYSKSGNPCDCLYCENNKYNNSLCTDRFGWDITIMNVNFNHKDEYINNKICYFIKFFLKIPSV